ncbi:MAG: T9SS type A sorting domain-containing protein, partial [bacterium]
DFLDVYDAMVAVDTTWVDPGLATTFDAAQIDSMIQNIEDLRAGITPATPYFWKLPTLPDGSPCDVCINWPLPEDFSYTNSQLLTAATDNLPLGDLNWFPTQKAQWEANKTQYIADIEALAGEKIILEVAATVEAEDGALGGDAAIEKFQGFSYFQMDGGGYIEWVFELPTGAQYDLNCWTHMRGNSMRGQRIIVNGVSIHDPKGWGEYIWDTADGPQAGMEINDWTWTLITQAEILEEGALTLPAGQNTIRIESSWGWQHFAGWDIIDFATQTTVLELRAPDVTDYAIVSPVGEGAAYTPSGFKSVALNTEGTITWNINAPADGNYRIQVYYQNWTGPQTGQVQVDGVNVISDLAFDSDADSIGLDVLSATSFDMTAGSHTLALAGKQIKVDYIQLIQEIVFVGVRPDHNELPLGYALKQNYPNPFNPTTKINFTVGKLSNVELTVYNVLGQKVATLVNKQMPAGDYKVIWDATDMSSGLYFYTMKVDKHTKTRKMMVIK